MQYRRTNCALAAATVLLSVAGARAAAADKKAYEQQVDVVYGQRDGIALVMDVFSPGGQKNGLAIIDIASGAYSSDRGKIRDHMMARVYDIFCGKGYTVFAIRPGSLSRYSIPEMVANIRTGIKWIRGHAGQYGIDPDNLGITGGSAGGHLACLTVVATPPGKDGSLDQPFKAVGVFFPPTDFLHFRGSSDFAKDEQAAQRMRNFVADRNPGAGKPDAARLTELAKSISPALIVDRKQPPFLIIHGDADPMVPLDQSKILVAALKKAGGQAELIVKHGGGHPWMTINEEVKVMADWFDGQLSKKGAKHE